MTMPPTNAHSASPENARTIPHRVAATITALETERDVLKLRVAYLEEEARQVDAVLENSAVMLPPVGQVGRIG